MKGNGMIETVATGAHGAVDKATRVVHHAVDSAAGAAVPAADWIGEKADAVYAMQEKVAKSSREAVTNHPWAVIGAALALGLLVGRILK